MFNVGLSLGTAIQTEDMFINCRAAGINYVEISCSYLEQAAQIDFKNIHRLSRENEIALWSFHLPFGPFSQVDISSVDADFRKNSVSILGEYLKKAADIGIDKYIIHPSGEPIAEEQRADRLAASKESLALLADIAAQSGGVMAVEDLPRTCLGRDSSDILELLSADDRLRVCFDTNHLLRENNVDFIRRVGDKIITTHISDYDLVNERHWLPGEGVNDWQELISALKETGYNGVWLYEISLQCPKTIFRDRDLICEDFVRNANELFAGKTPTVFSLPKPGVGMWE